MIGNNDSKEAFIANIIKDCITQAIEYETCDQFQRLSTRNTLQAPFPTNNPTFRVMSYNVMADSLSAHNKEKNKYWEDKYIDWEYRCKLLLQEVKQQNADIIGFQEIDKDQKDFENALKDKYWCFYKCRTNDKNDGCMTAVKKSVFDLLETYYIEYNLNSSDPILDRDNVCQIIVCKHKASGLILLVANTHLLFSDNRGDIKTAQIHLAQKSLSILANKNEYKKANKSIIYMGDFNSIPNSGLYSFIRNGEFRFTDQRTNLLSGQKLGQFKLSTKFDSVYEYLITNTNFYRYFEKNKENKMDLLQNWMSHLKKIAPKIPHQVSPLEPVKITLEVSESEEKIPLNDQQGYVLKNPYKMTSAYSKFNSFYHNLHTKQILPEVNLPKYSTYEPLFTSKTVSHFLTVDYIWFTNQGQYHDCGLRVRAIHELPRLPLIQQVFNFPNRNYPSDHFSLVVDFEILQ